MAQQIVKEDFNYQEKDVLLAPHLAFTIAVQVTNTGVSAVNGRKIIPAGTPVGEAASALAVRNTVLKVTNDSSTGAQAQGILRHDVDVTNGAANAELVIMGVVDSSKCPKIDSTVKLPHIIFVNGGAK